MALTIKDMKIGDRLVFGAYGVDNDSPDPIVWIKASNYGDFISEHVLDLLIFDESEFPAYATGNPSYELSNVRQFLNSSDAMWFEKTHAGDARPTTRYGSRHTRDHYGFLYHFEDYEIDSLNVHIDCYDGRDIESLIRLPRSSEVRDGVLPLFKRKGVRTTQSEDLAYSRIGCGSTSAFCEYWFANRDALRDSYVNYMRRDARVDSVAPYCCLGIRPLCTVKIDVEIQPHGTIGYEIKPRFVDSKTCKNEDICELLGLVMP